MINTLMKQSEFQSMPVHFKSQIIAVSNVSKEENLELVELSGENYYHIVSELSLALNSPLSKYEMLDIETITGIIESGSYNPETSPITVDGDGIPIFRGSNISYDETMRVRHKGIFSDSILAGESKNIDWKIDQLTYQGQNVPAVMTGVRYKVVGGNDGDQLNFQVIDIDNIIGYGENVVLDTFSDGFYIFQNDVAEIREHRAAMIPGLYIRAQYLNNGAASALFTCNLLRYIDTSGI